LQESLASLEASLQNALNELTLVSGHSATAEANARWYRNAFYAALALDLIQLTIGSLYVTGKIVVRVPWVIRVGYRLARAGYHTTLELPELARNINHLIQALRAEDQTEVNRIVGSLLQPIGNLFGEAVAEQMRATLQESFTQHAEKMIEVLRNFLLHLSGNDLCVCDC